MKDFGKWDIQTSYDVELMNFMERNVGHLVNLEKNACGRKCNVIIPSSKQNTGKSTMKEAPYCIKI
jgi:hypothetical protein